MPADTPLTGLSLVLKPTTEQSAALTQLLADQQDPTKADYHKWLTPREYGERFGLGDEDLAVLRAWLQSAGLHVDEVPESRNLIRFSGTAADVTTAFGTTLSQYRDAAQSFYENSSPVQLPSTVAAVVQGISGLSSYRLAPHHARMSAEQVAAAASTRNGMAAAQYTTTGSKGTVHYLVPWDFRQIYGINTLIGSGFDGTGIKIGIIGQSAVDTQQLTYFQGKTGQPTRMPAMVLVPNTGTSNRVSGDEAESELDLEYSSGSAPGASVQFIYTGCTAAASSTALSGTTDCGNDGVFTALGYAITNNLAPILSISYGDCESSVASFASSTMEPLLKQANAQGQTVLVSSGDAGAAACDQTGSATVATHGLTVAYPASSSYVTAVGGTQLNSDSSTDWSSTNNGSLGSAAGYINETTWNDTATTTVILSSGGGSSKIISTPAWQTPYQVAGTSFRMVPDVSFASSVAFHPYMVCLGDATCTSGTGGFTPGSDGIGVGGTSVAAPNFAAMIAVVEQANGGTALGNLGPVLYTAAHGTQASSIFHDVTTGNNAVPCKALSTLDCSTATGSMGYSAGSGYDLATGLGSVNAPGLRAALQTASARAVVLSLRTIPQTSDIISPRLGDPFTVVVDVLTYAAPEATGSVSVKLDGVLYGAPSALRNNETSLSLVLKTLGAHSIDVTYSGDPNYNAASASTTVTGLQAKPTISLATPYLNVGHNVPVPFTVSVSPGSIAAMGTVVITVDGTAVLQPFSLTNNSVTFSYPGFTTEGKHTVVATYSGDPLILPGVSGTASLIVPPRSESAFASMIFTATPSPPAAGSPTIFFVKVTGDATSVTPKPTGYVTLIIDRVSLPTIALDANGQASFSYTYPVPTTTTQTNVEASYSGDDIYMPQSGSLNLSIPGPPLPPAENIALSLSGNSATIPSTGLATVGMNVSSMNGFAGPVSFASSILSSTGASFSGCYTVSPGVVYVKPDVPVTATFSIALSSSSLCANGTKSSVRMAASPDRPRPGNPSAWTIAAAFGVVCGAMFRRKKIRSLLSAAVLACALGATGCGGSSGSSSTTTTTTTVPPPTSTTSSTAGTYQVRVTATAQTTGVSSSGTFTLTVQ